MKSELLNIFEQYLLPLGVELKPALPGFIAGVLLGLEEGTEFYDRFVKSLNFNLIFKSIKLLTFICGCFGCFHFFLFRSFFLLDRVQDSVGSESYFACLWEAVLGSPSVRLPALMYVNAKFNRRKSMHDQEYIMGNNIDHMVMLMSSVHI